MNNLCSPNILPCLEIKDSAAPMTKSVYRKIPIQIIESGFLGFAKFTLF